MYYLEICPRSFKNEIIYLAVPLARVPDAEKIIEQFRGEPNGYAQWATNQIGPLQAIPFNDRKWAMPCLA